VNQIGIRLFIGASLMLATAYAQTPATTTGTPAQAPAPASAPAPAPAATPPPSPFTQWGTDFSFLFDGYVDANFNHPDSGFNGLRNFDVRSDTAHLSSAMITIDHAPGPVGFHLDAGFGQQFRIIGASDRAPDDLDYIQQAYVSLKPKSWHGLEIDAGKFWTAAGAEVVPTNQDWNYSRSLLFALAIPYYHFGVRASFPIGPHFTGGVQLVQGWNDVYDNNSGKTIGLNGAYAWKKVTWTNVYYVGPEKAHTNQGWRNLYDTTVAVNPTDKISYYINFDYGRDKYAGAPGAAQWTGIAGAAHFQLTPKTALATRLEFFDDMDGFATGTAQQLKEFTLTGEYKLTGWLLSRLEFRNDWSNVSYFEGQNGSTSRSQPTVLLGMVAFFGPKK
jgi:Putative beta-barrel porin-2, OmpL-like. bbp2